MLRDDESDALTALAPKTVHEIEATEAPKASASSLGGTVRTEPEVYLGTTGADPMFSGGLPANSIDPKDATRSGTAGQMPQFQGGASASSHEDIDPPRNIPRMLSEAVPMDKVQNGWMAARSFMGWGWGRVVDGASKLSEDIANSEFAKQTETFASKTEEVVSRKATEVSELTQVGFSKAREKVGEIHQDLQPTIEKTAEHAQVATERASELAEQMKPKLIEASETAKSTLKSAVWTAASTAIWFQSLGSKGVHSDDEEEVEEDKKQREDAKAESHTSDKLNIAPPTNHMSGPPLGAAAAVKESESNSAPVLPVTAAAVAKASESSSAPVPPVTAAAAAKASESSSAPVPPITAAAAAKASESSSAPVPPVTTAAAAKASESSSAPVPPVSAAAAAKASESSPAPVPAPATPTLQPESADAATKHAEIPQDSTEKAAPQE